jgi:hypothetical protein
MRLVRTSGKRKQMTGDIIEQKHVHLSGHEEILMQHPSKEIKNKMYANNESIIRCNLEYASTNLH